jgi:hemerythrin-like domain-containing protein
MVGITIGSKPLAGFDQPIELLKDCHRRIEHFISVLQKVVEQYGDRKLPEEGRRALETALEYFARAAPRHTADEEQSLFPRLRRTDDAEAIAVISELNLLEAEHRRADACHAQVEALGREWLEAEYLNPNKCINLRALLQELSVLYAAHIQLEEERVFEIAVRTLAADDLDEMGAEMRQRRIEN